MMHNREVKSDNKYYRHINMVRKFVLLLFVMIAVSATAQKLQTVDKDGQPIPYASIIGEDGNIIGTTGLDGILDDVKGVEVVSITHVAYQPKKVKVGHGGRITLEDADFGLPEITVTKKPLVYVQTYYRMVFLNDGAEMPICYYRAGVLNNSFERKKKNVSSDEEHFSACNKGIFKTALNTILGAYIKKIAGLKMDKVENRMMKKYKDIGLSFVADGPGKQRITDKYGTVGTVADNQEKGERRYYYESQKLSKHMVLATGSDKKKAKVEKKEESQKDRVDQDFIVYRIDEEGNYSPEDYVMAQVATSYYDEKNKGHVNILLQVFTTECAYVTKDELKQRKKDNKMKMTYQNVYEFERAHKIPAIPADLQKRLNEVMK